MAENYHNPRIDEDQADAWHGEVYADPAKLLWIGSMLVFGTVGSALTASPGAILLFVVSTGLTLCLGHSLGMHRLFIHRAWQAPKWLEYLFVHFGVLVGLAGPMGMLKTHDLRDWAQRQGRCHSYFGHDEVWYRDLWWQLFCSIRLDNEPTIEPEPAIAEDRVYRFMEKTWMLQQLPWALIFFMLGGLSWVFWGICSRVSVSVLGHWLIGHFAHNSGHREWHVEGAAVQGYNVPFAGLLTMGESWHNNHHAFPGSAKLGLHKDQWDPGWWVLRALERLGLAWDIVTPDMLPERDELRLRRSAPDTIDGSVVDAAGVPREEPSAVLRP
ncbi:MAG: acyl-CoA desaturase [Woeseiaceae bacterium]|nr:acyl-CoA desaturase [Woeseiaceae bacterium]